MKKRFTFLMAAVMLLMMMSLPGKAVGQSTTTYTFSSKSWAASPANWTSGKDGAQMQSGRGVQVTQAATGANATSPSSYNNISQIVVTYSTNANNGVGSIEIKVGTNVAVSQNVTKTGGTTDRTLTWTYSPNQSGSVKLTVNCATNSIYVKSVAITTAPTGTPTTTTINATGINNNIFGGNTDGGSLAASVTVTSGGAAVGGATVSWSSSNTSVATIASDGAVTLNTTGNTTITATYAGNATYSGSSATYLLTVINEDPDLETIWSENFSSYSDTDVPTGGTYGYTCVNGTSNTQIYDANLAGGEKPELLVGRGGGSFTATIPLLHSTYGYSGDLILTFKANNTNVAVSTTTTGVTITGSVATGTSTLTLSGVTTSTENVVITFTNSNSSNVRIDDIVLKGVRAELTTVATPVISPASGAVVSGTEVTMTCATEGASIYYTMGADPADPTTSSTLYNSSSKPTITEATTIKAIAIKAGLDNSTIASVNYTLAAPCATPTFSVAAGEVDKGTTVEISTATDGATIYYTTNGDEPTTSSTTYSSAITINSNMTIKAIAAKDGNANSAVASATYTIRDYATLPFTWNEKATTTQGVTSNNNVGTYNSSPYLKLNSNDGEGYVILKLNEDPGAIKFDVKGNPSSGTAATGTFSIMISSDGTFYSTIASYTSIVNQTQTLSFTSIPSGTRYIKWHYYKASGNGNIAIGNFIVTKAMNINDNTIWTPSTFTPVDNYSYVVNSNAILTISGDYGSTFNNPSIIIVEDGGQLICNNSVAATVKKNISSWNTGAKAVGGWSFIASPIAGTIDPKDAGLVTDDLGNTATTSTATYDLYYLNMAAEKDHEWQNYRKNTFNLANGKGYLYANVGSPTLNFSGDIQPSNTTVTKSDLYDGYNLVGNPFTCNAYLNRYYYTLNGDGSAIVVDDPKSAPIAPCTGVIIENSSVTFSKNSLTVESSNNGNVQMALSQSVVTRGESTAKTLDKAIVSFNEDDQLGKFYFGSQDANLYIPMDNEEYAVVSSSAQGEMPVNFKAHRDGQYTITVNPQEVKMGYLHLIDNVAGKDIDLLATPSYTFNAKADDYESRFRLVFSANMVNTDLNDDFAFFSNGQLVIANEGESLLQVIDVNGRIVMTESVNGTCSKAINVKAGVYVLRLIQGTDVKTQKIIVK